MYWQTLLYLGGAIALLFNVLARRGWLQWSKYDKDGRIWRSNVSLDKLVVIHQDLASSLLQHWVPKALLGRRERAIENLSEAMRNAMTYNGLHRCLIGWRLVARDLRRSNEHQSAAINEAVIEIQREVEYEFRKRAEACLMNLNAYLQDRNLTKFDSLFTELSLNLNLAKAGIDPLTLQTYQNTLGGVRKSFDTKLNKQLSGIQHRLDAGLCKLESATITAGLLDRDALAPHADLLNTIRDGEWKAINQATGRARLVTTLISMNEEITYPQKGLTPDSIAFLKQNSFADSLTYAECVQSDLLSSVVRELDFVGQNHLVPSDQKEFHQILALAGDLPPCSPMAQKILVEVILPVVVFSLASDKISPSLDALSKQKRQLQNIIEQMNRSSNIDLKRLSDAIEVAWEGRHSLSFGLVWQIALDCRETLAGSGFERVANSLQSIYGKAGERAYERLSRMNLHRICTNIIGELKDSPLCGVVKHAYSSSRLILIPEDLSLDFERVSSRGIIPQPPAELFGIENDFAQNTNEEMIRINKRPIVLSKGWEKLDAKYLMLRSGNGWEDHNKLIGEKATLLSNGILNGRRCDLASQLNSDFPRDIRGPLVARRVIVSVAKFQPELRKRLFLMGFLDSESFEDQLSLDRSTYNKYVFDVGLTTEVIKDPLSSHGLWPEEHTWFLDYRPPQ
jgi:hypothetical protein